MLYDNYYSIEVKLGEARYVYRYVPYFSCTPDWVFLHTEKGYLIFYPGIENLILPRLSREGLGKIRISKHPCETNNNFENSFFKNNLFFINKN